MIPEKIIVVESSKKKKENPKRRRKGEQSQLTAAVELNLGTQSDEEEEALIEEAEKSRQAEQIKQGLAKQGKEYWWLSARLQ